MKPEYIDTICNNLRESLKNVVDASSGFPERCTFIFSYPNSTVLNGIAITFDIKRGDKEDLNES